MKLSRITPKEDAMVNFSIFNMVQFDLFYEDQKLKSYTHIYPLMKIYSVAY